MALATESPKQKPDRTWLYAGAFFALSWVVVLIFFGGDLITAEYAADEASPVVMADFVWPMKDLEDHPADFSKYKGKTVFLNIWATSCGPCVKEMPSIAKLASEPRLRDVAFLCVSTDESAEPVKEFLRGKAWPMTMLRADTAPEVFRTEGIPATFIIAPDGTIASSILGAEEWDDPKFVAMLMKLSAPKPPAADSPAKDLAKAK